jgi:glycine cleavage system H protein
VDGEVVEVNEAVVADPRTVNRDPYGAGWVARIRPDDLEGALGGMVTGEAGIEAYRAFMEAEGITCAER